MAMTYGISTGINQNANNTDEYVFVQGTNGQVVKHYKKHRRVETVTESLPDSASLPTVNGPSTFRKELRMSNTDFARLSVTAVTFAPIP